jgi:nicotinamide-nucleotide amidase
MVVMNRSALMAALAVGFALQRSRARLMLAESCTGGLASSWLTDIAGSSHWFDGGVVSYANATKVGFLGVKEATIRLHGAVSSQTAAEMAEGLRRQHRKSLVSFGTHTTATLAAASVTGVAGPTGGTPAKPLGLVCFGWSGPWGLETEQRRFQGNRSQIREQAAFYALSGILARLSRG